jgi:hypothetical protein
LEEFEARPVTIQMVLRGALTARGPDIELRPVTSEADWDALQRLVRADHVEGRRSAGLGLSVELSRKMVTTFQTKSSAYHFDLAIKEGLPMAYRAHAASPNGAGIIEDCSHHHRRGARASPRRSLQLSPTACGRPAATPSFSARSRPSRRNGGTTGSVFIRSAWREPG